jgi:GNAT superfamily N-acetyltransferase
MIETERDGPVSGPAAGHDGPGRNEAAAGYDGPGMNQAAVGRRPREAAPSPLAALLTGIAAGVYPPADGHVTVLPQPSPRDAGVLALTAHTVVFADVDPGWVRRRLPADDLSAPLNPPFLSELTRLTGRRVNSIDMLCFAPALAGPPSTSLVAAPASGHPRAARARRYRDGVQAWEASGGLVILGRGVAGRWEIAVEVAPERRGEGLGRKLAAAARHLIPAGEPLWAQIAPGNSASVRAFLAAGYVPVAAEALLVRA